VVREELSQLLEQASAAKPSVLLESAPILL
jgi:hypothetical protein